MSTSPLTIDHLIPQSLGGSDQLNNLALACHRCNERRYNFTTGIDPETQLETPLFNPRKQQWIDHFIWIRDGLKILGTTPIGRATCNRLDINDDFHNDGFIQESRQYWVDVGWHPPREDPRISE
ncbi:HNH endonuclease [Symplocastrum sp. BBK-W-15]|uniref:HNH endonuclease n=1 Tax=Limnofasciculus baicalensis BBK-W-15 TaxID=2699891 RepID=A0AAE3GUB5_9CYAN|nr:HNH endonuclease [Limnofasciculus baicalensis]MCP2730116.1 HNH endonuclease [Limnofasciculus baicalensis BBK-W-15]